MHPLAQLDHRYVWHPFTQMRDWLKREPILIVRGQGAELVDVRGRRYLDANASIWTNLHGHNHPRLNAALQRQLQRIAHVSALGLANEPASKLAARLVAAANPSAASASPRQASPPLAKVFFSDDGSTAMEVALKLAYEFTRRSGLSDQPRFLSLSGAYHGDTVGAVSLGHIDLFHAAYAGLLFKSDRVMAPYCYRCPFNRAQPERADARDYRRCRWECVGQVEQRFEAARRRDRPYAAFVIEPLVQGAAGMVPQPAGWLGRVTDLARGHRALVVADEVLTGFGRANDLLDPSARLSAKTKVGRNVRIPAGTTSVSGLNPPLFACHQEAVQPDFLAVAKGLTGGYLPMAATLTTQAVFDAFLGKYAEFKTFFHGHSYTAHPLGAATALASLDVLESSACIRARRRLQRVLAEALGTLWDLPQVGDIRRVGLVAGVELVKDWRTREPFALAERVGLRVCEVMAQRGVLTRPIGNVVVLMPPYCTTPVQVEEMVAALRAGMRQALGAGR
jgi:adenosylmethionine-8-amino-7-oxononanoate aminotransferase